MFLESDANFSYEKSIGGHFYAIGVGPGSPDLLTLRAVRCIESADVIVAPRSAIAKSSLAFDTIKSLVNKNQIIIDHQYAMIRDEDTTLERWHPIAQTIVDYCNKGKSVVQITIGDPLIYSTIAYVFPFILENLGNKKIHIVPGISAFQITASKFGFPLTIQEDRLCIMPATDLDAVRKALESCETLVLYKCSKQLSALSQMLSDEGLAEDCKVVCYAEQGNREVIFNDIDSAASNGNGYMATAIIYAGRKKWKHVANEISDAVCLK